MYIKREKNRKIFAFTNKNLVTLPSDFSTIIIMYLLPNAIQYDENKQQMFQSFPLYRCGCTSYSGMGRMQMGTRKGRFPIFETYYYDI